MTNDEFRELADALYAALRRYHEAMPTAAPAAPQAEPKREPNPDEVICPACTHQFRAIPENVQAQLWAKRDPLSDWRIGELYRQWLAESGTTTITDLMRSVERAHEIGGSDAGTD